MKIQIKNRYTEKVIIEGEAENLKEFLEKNREAGFREADLRGADLYGANLSESNLYGADFRGADLRKATLYESDLYKADLSEATITTNQKDGIIKSLGIIVKK